MRGKNFPSFSEKCSIVGLTVVDRRAHDEVIGTFHLLGDDNGLAAMDEVTIRKAERKDVPLLLEFIKGIARYEKMENEVIATAEVLKQEMSDEPKMS